MKIKYAKGLLPEAVEFGEEILKELESQNVVQELDTRLLELAVTSYHIFLTAQKCIIDKGAVYELDGYLKRNPAVPMLKDAQVQLFKAFSELGMSPKSRKQLNQMPDVPGETSSPLDSYLGRLEKRSNHETNALN